MRLRGTVQAITTDKLTLKERSGEVIELALSDKQVVDGKPTATRVNAGRNGFALPY